MAAGPALMAAGDGSSSQISSPFPTTAGCGRPTQRRQQQQTLTGGVKGAAVLRSEPQAQQVPPVVESLRWRVGWTGLVLGHSVAAWDEAGGRRGCRKIE